MKLVLERFCYSETETEGRLYINETDFLYTLERPWVPGAPGGMPFASCVPDGSFGLVPHTRPNGDEVLALRNPDLHVFYTDEERAGRPGRYLILIHAGNYVSDVVGCIAPGVVRAIVDNRRMVQSSRLAMSRIMAGGYNQIDIRPALGAVM